MIKLNSKYDNIHRNRMFYVLLCINNHVITSISCMLSQVHFGGPFKANWAHGESLKAKKFYRGTKILMTNFAGLGICKYLFVEA